MNKQPSISVNLSQEDLIFNSSLTINHNFSWTSVNIISTIINNLTVLFVNILVLVWLKVKEKTLVDMMVILDCVANILVIGVFALCFPIRVWGYQNLCLIIAFYRNFVLILNRVIPLTVLLYRVLMVCHVEFCYKQGERAIRNKLLRFCLIFPMTTGIFTLIYHNNVRDYLICANREEFLRYDLHNFWATTNYINIRSEDVTNLEWYHPFSLLIYSAFWAHFLLVPLGYLRILYFLRKQNKHILAIAPSKDRELMRRRKKNIVSIGFNLLAWSFDVLGDIIGLIFYRYYFLLAMSITLGVSCGLTPIAYIIGASQFRNKRNLKF